MSTVAEETPERSALLEERQRRLAGRVSSLGGRIGAGARDRGLLIIGATLVVLGVAAIVLGWIGASDTVVVFEQVPYLISGGLLGLALVLVGTFTFFAYWLTVIVRENRELRRQLSADREELLRQQQLVVDTLEAMGALLTQTRAGTDGGASKD